MVDLKNSKIHTTYARNVQSGNLIMHALIKQKTNLLRFIAEGEIRTEEELANSPPKENSGLKKN